ncbi:MAG: RrF2 family transcriptional regulator [Erysipelotrichaceae bacterium]
MLISTKGRYAVRVLCDMAINNGHEQYISLPEIAARQEISLKYMEKIMLLLVKGNIIDSVHGKGGGYRLKRKPEEYTILEILELTEETLAPVECLKKDAKDCPRKEKCPTVAMWKESYELLKNYYGNKTIKDLIKE